MEKTDTHARQVATLERVARQVVESHRAGEPDPTVDESWNYTLEDEHIETRRRDPCMAALIRRLRFAWIRLVRDLRRTHTTHFTNNRHRYWRIP